MHPSHIGASVALANWPETLHACAPSRKGPSPSLQYLFLTFWSLELQKNPWNSNASNLLILNPNLANKIIGALAEALPELGHVPAWGIGI